MTRQEIYNVLDKERNYQDQVWDKDHSHEHEVGSWLVYMQHYLNRAVSGLTTSSGNKEALIQLRKIAALSIACFEVHGVPER